jgi:hypothetical protein
MALVLLLVYTAVDTNGCSSGSAVVAVRLHVTICTGILFTGLSNRVTLKGEQCRRKEPWLILTILLPQHEIISVYKNVTVEIETEDKQCVLGIRYS